MKPFRTTGFRSRGSIVVFAVLAAWHAALGLDLINPWSPIFSPPVFWLALMLIPATLISSIWRSRPRTDPFDYYGPVLAIAATALILVECFALFVS